MKKIILFVLLFGWSSFVSANPLSVCATTPELGNLIQTIGGAEVNVTVFVKPTEDPHFIEAKPSFIKALSNADALIFNGLGLEIGWLPVLLQNARNRDVLSGGRGYMDASQAIHPLGSPKGIIDRSLGDVHAQGNPHYLLDPINGIKVAGFISDRLGVLLPTKKDTFSQNYIIFSKMLGTSLVGEKLFQAYDLDKLGRLYSYGKLENFLTSQGQGNWLSGWFKEAQSLRGKKVVVDHNLWLYFANRYGFEIVASMEPKPGIPPSTRHLRRVVNQMKQENVQMILTSAYYNPRYAQFLAGKTGAKIYSLANQVGAQPGTSTYLTMSAYNIEKLVQ